MNVYGRVFKSTDFLHIHFTYLHGVVTTNNVLKEYSKALESLVLDSRSVQSIHTLFNGLNVQPLLVFDC